KTEISGTNKAKCKSTVCDKSVITKGDVRLGTWVEIKGHGSFQWRHWGCVTAKVISNLKEAALDTNGEFTTDLVDGFPDLDAETQEKVRSAIEAGNVADEDWKGAPGGNLPNPPKAKKSSAEDNEDNDSEEAE
ncbi:hypothetical protein BZA77DRAFT_254168, partial [Pyronema omphalodes]